MGATSVEAKKVSFTLNLVLVFVLLFQAISNAQIPAGYYTPATGLTGDALKSALNGIIDGHTAYPYTSTGVDVWEILKVADRDPNDASKVIGFYSGFSMDAAAEYASGAGWNREHVWAKSRGDFGTVPNAGTDCHHIVAEDVSTNSARNNRNFDWGDSFYTDASGNYSGPTQSKIGNSGNWVWEPRDSKKGDIARMIFYMAVRYEGVGGDPDLELTETLLSNTDLSPFHAKQSVLLEWHNLDPVSAEEEARNEVIFSYQKNRNPFIDHPEYVCEIWGGSCTARPTIENITHLPNNPGPSDAVSVSADITDEGSIVSATLNWGINGSTFPNSINMTDVGTPTFTTNENIPAQTIGTMVYYKLTVVSSTGETTISSSYSYSIPYNEPSDYPTLFATGTLASSSIQLNWVDASTGTLPNAYLIKASKVSNATIAVPTDGTVELDASMVKNVSQGIQTLIFDRLDAGSTYYFNIFPYSNSGSNINYKSNEIIPGTSGQTNEASINATETLDNYTLTAGVYANGQFLGQDGSIWNYLQCRGDMQITGSTLCLGKGRAPNAAVSSGTISGGCGILNLDYKQAFSTNVNLELYINDELITTLTSSSQEGVILNSGDIVVKKSGNFVMKFINTSSVAGQVSIDNISWTPFTIFESSDELTICESELPYNYNGKIIDLGTTSSNIDFTYTSVDGYDSIVTLNLTVNPVYNISDQLVICGSELPYNYYGETIPEATTSGEIDFYFVSINGCDSIVTLDLSVNPFCNSSDALVICVSELPYNYYGKTIAEGTTSGEIDFSFVSTDGFDSIVTLDLTVNPVFNTSDQLVICGSELPYNYYGKTIAEGTTSGQIEFSFVSISGCDSTVTLYLTVNSGYDESLTVALCQGESYLFGSQVLTDAGEYQESFSSITGCDSIVTLTLSVNHIETNVSQEGATLTSNAIVGTYQWATCGDVLTPIDGETNQTFTSTVNGSFAVIISNLDCVDYSECYNITGVGVIETSFLQEFTPFPNPTSGDLTIDTQAENGKLQVSIFDVLGRQVYSNKFENERMLNIDLKHLSKGIYTLKIQGVSQEAVFQIVKE